MEGNEELTPIFVFSLLSIEPANMKFKLSLLLTFTFLWTFAERAQAQNISGTINTYTNVTNIVTNVVTVGSAAGLSVGDKVLLIQMKGATITTGNVAGFGTITGYGNAGNYEFLTVAAIAGNQVTMTTNPCQTYTIAGAVQLVRVPVYTNPNITGTLTATDWNGTIGGVLAFEATGTVTFNANIDISGTGFRGGLVANGGFNCNDPGFADGTKGKKGEGIATAPAGQDANKNPLANGGGGSNTGNPGAGGGGNYGIGGRGGDEFLGWCATTTWGMGGYGLTMNSSKAFMGGGGGGGFRDNGLTCQPGSDGGGIVFINAPTIAGNGFAINSNGLNITLITDSEGAGGGGAGGAAYIWTNTVSSPLTINVRGGNGGNIQSTIWSSACHGPGAGGGGGYVWFSTPATPANAVVNAVGGNPGIILHPGQPCSNTPHGATAGAAGASLFNLPVPAPPSPLADLGNDTTICFGQNITLQTSVGYASYTWSTGAVTPTINVNTTGTYWVDVPIGCGTIDRDTIVVTVGTASVNIGPDQSFCQGDSAFFDAGAGYTSYAWNTGATSSSIYTNSVGQYIVSVVDAVGCSASDTANVLNVFPLPVINLGPDSTQCGGNILLNAGAGYPNYQWQNATTNSTLTASTTGTYWVLVTDANNCFDYDSVDITINPVPAPNLGPDVSFCIGQSVTLNPGAFTGYLWSNAATTPTIIVNTAGTYSVTVTNASGCTNTDAMTVQNVYPLPTPNLGPDQQICYGNTIVLSPGVYSAYQWQDGSGPAIYPVGNSGTYYVEVTDANGCQYSDTTSITVFPLPLFSLGPDLAICPGDDIEIIPAGPSVPVTYLWNDGSTNPTMVDPAIGGISLIVTDTNTCTYRDTLVVSVDCPWTMYVPNAFTPNEDEINPIFKAYGSNIKEYKMEIFNRWGQLIYTLNDLTEGWNGMYNGQEAPVGQYVYKVTYRNYIKADDIYLTGGFALIR